MTIWFVVPVKPFALGKSRLVEILTNQQRISLNSSLLRLTLQTIMQVPIDKQVAVVSRDESALQMAMRFGARAIIEDEKIELNTALRLATGVAQAEGADGIFILPADLPLIQPEDVCGLLENATRKKEMIITPDSRKYGTNAMLLFPPGMVEYCYGPSSFVLHTDQAKQKGMRLVVYRNKSLEFDLDQPEDLSKLSANRKFHLFDNQKEMP